MVVRKKNEREKSTKSRIQTQPGWKGEEQQMRTGVFGARGKKKKNQIKINRGENGRAKQPNYGMNNSE